MAPALHIYMAQYPNLAYTNCAASSVPLSIYEVIAKVMPIVISKFCAISPVLNPRDRIGDKAGDTVGVKKALESLENT